MSLIVNRNALTFESAMPSSWRRSGTRVSACLFCAVCGSRLAHLPEDQPTAAVKAGTLDDCGWLVPAAELWLDEAQPWQHRAEWLPGHARGPDDYSAIIATFQRWLQEVVP